MLRAAARETRWPPWQRYCLAGVVALAALAAGAAWQHRNWFALAAFVVWAPVLGQIFLSPRLYLLTSGHLLEVHLGGVFLRVPLRTVQEVRPHAGGWRVRWRSAVGVRVRTLYIPDALGQALHEAAWTAPVPGLPRLAPLAAWVFPSATRLVMLDEHQLLFLVGDQVVRRVPLEQVTGLRQRWPVARVTFKDGEQVALHVGAGARLVAALRHHLEQRPAD